MKEPFIAPIPPPDAEAARRAAERWDRLTKPLGSLGRLESWVCRYAAIRRDPLPPDPAVAAAVFAADHGVCEEGVSAYPSEVTRQMVENFLRGGACINALARWAGARVVVVDVGVKGEVAERHGLWVRKEGRERGTANLALGPAMGREEAVGSLRAGAEVARELAREGASALALGDMGIGNTTAASCVTAAMTGRPPREVVGTGTGLDREGWSRKVAVVERALALHRPDPADPVGVLSRVGGFELGAIAGAILGGAGAGVALFLDGFIAGAGALLARALDPACAAYLFPSHLSREPGHRAQLEALDLPAVLDLEMCLGEGTGAILAAGLLTAALRAFREMATFESAGVSEAL